MTATDQSPTGASSGLEPLRNELLKLYDRMEGQIEEGMPLEGVTTGLTNWDLVTGRLTPGQLHIIGARPGVGKSSLALHVASHGGMLEGRCTALFTPSIKRDEVIRRILSAQADISSRSMVSSSLTEDEWTRLAVLIEAIYTESLLYIDDSFELDAQDILRKCEPLKEHGLSLVVINGLEFLKPIASQDSHEGEMASIARSLKRVALALNVPLVVTCGISRDVERRGSQRPILSDLPEGLEDIADGICLLYRRLDSRRLLDAGESPPRDVWVEQVEMIFAKNSDGPVGMTVIGFVPAFRKFVDWEDSEPPAEGF